MARRYRLLWGVAVMVVAALMGMWTVQHTLSPSVRTSSSFSNASRRLPFSCGAAGGSQANAQSFTAAQAIAKVNNIDETMFPATPGARGGQIHEGPLQGGTIPGHLTTRVQPVGPNSYLVTLTEQWTRQAFPVSGHSRIGHHQWTFKVTPHLAQVQSESGDYPPQATK